MSKLVKKKFKISGMHCSACAMSIDFVLEDMNGVRESKTSYAKQTTEVSYISDQLKAREIILAIAKTGYIAKEIS